MELTSSSHRTLAGNLALASYTIDEIFATLFAYIARNWLNMKWLTSGFYALILLYLSFVPESPFWMFSMKKFDQLEIFLRKTAIRNGRDDTDSLPYYKQLIQASQVATKEQKGMAKTYVISFIPRLCISGLIGVITMLLYIKIAYGLALMNDTLSPYISVILGAIVEGIGYLSANFVMTTRLGRKYSFMLYSLLTAGCVLTIPFITNHYPIPTIIISQLGKLAISGAISISWIYVPELVPTSIRGLSNALLIFLGRLAPSWHLSLTLRTMDDT